MTTSLRAGVVLALAVALAAAAPAAGKRKPPIPPPPPDTAADCRVEVEASVDEYILFATLVVAVRCDTVKGSITVSGEFSRDGAAVPLLPYDSRTCTNTSACGFAIDLFSYDNHPVAFPGDQRYCATGRGVVGGQAVAPASGCEEDPRL